MCVRVCVCMIVLCTGLRQPAAVAVASTRIENATMRHMPTSSFLNATILSGKTSQRASDNVINVFDSKQPCVLLSVLPCLRFPIDIVRLPLVTRFCYPACVGYPACAINATCVPIFASPTVDVPEMHKYIYIQPLLWA